MKAQQHHTPLSRLSTSGRLTKSFLISLTLLSCLLSILLPAENSFSAEEEPVEPAGKIVFLPFTVQTIKPQQYLQDGLTDILATRMTNRTGLIAVHKSSETRQLAALMETGDQKSFKNILNTIDADYLVIGSLEQQDTAYEIMIYVFNRKRPTPSSFSKKISALNRAIPAMDEISIEIAEQVFNKKQQKQLVSTTPEGEGTSGFQTAHPDRAFKEGLYKPSAILGIDGDEFSVLSSRRSRKIMTPVRGMVVGDLDGKGSEERVLVGQGNITIYRLNSDHFQRVAEHPIPGYLAPHAVNLADLDGNGLLEIYISANNGDKPSSLIFEWDGSNFHTLYEDVPYYLRPGKSKEGIEILIGQQAGPTGPAGRNFYQIVKTANGALEKGKKLMIPKGFNLFDFIWSDLDQNGAPEFIGITSKNELIVMDQSGNPIWKSDASYGASKDFLGTLSSNRPGGRTPTYMHTRLIARDQDGDGKPEIIIGRNRLTSVKFFNRLRYFEGSSISALRWDGSGMTTLWETEKTPGYTTDYQVAGAKGQPEHLSLYFIESNSSYPMFFWEVENSVIHYYEMGRKNQQSDN